jgi:hypothetical protein
MWVVIQYEYTDMGPYQDADVDVRCVHDPFANLALANQFAARYRLRTHEKYIPMKLVDPS